MILAQIGFEDWDFFVIWYLSIPLYYYTRLKTLLRSNSQIKKFNQDLYVVTLMTFSDANKKWFHYRR